MRSQVLMLWNLINSLELHSSEVTPTTADSITESLLEKGLWQFASETAHLSQQTDRINII